MNRVVDTKPLDAHLFQPEVILRLNLKQEDLTSEYDLVIPELVETDSRSFVILGFLKTTEFAQIAGVYLQLIPIQNTDKRFAYL